MAADDAHIGVTIKHSFRIDESRPCLQGRLGGHGDSNDRTGNPYYASHSANMAKNILDFKLYKFFIIVLAMN